MAGELNETATTAAATACDNKDMERHSGFMTTPHIIKTNTEKDKTTGY
ncbi:hypothetical protein [Escherichia coli]|nr:hypothetical protein [Escherichia coli]